MRDPHVEALVYAAGSGSETIVYVDRPTPLAFANSIGHFDLAAGVLAVHPAEHFASEADARAVVDAFLEAWEIKADLLGNIGRIRFKCKRAEIIDRAPPDGKEHMIEARGVSSTSFVGRAVIQAVCAAYPDPPTGFAISEDVQTAHARWVRFREGRERLTVMAYYLLTLIEKKFGGRRGAATSLAIHPKVLGRLGELSSGRGTPEQARKVYRSKLVALSDAELRWLEVVCERIVQRLGEHAAGAPCSAITMKDLPAI